MPPGTNDEREAALRPLRAIGGVVSSLRSGSLPEDEQRSAVVQVASAAEMTLRRVLRDHPEIPIETRLSALAPDELRADEVLAELRRHDRISMPLAASVHDLLEVRRRLREGTALRPEDRTLAYEVASRLEREVASPNPAPATRAAAPAPVTAVDEDVTAIYQDPKAPVRRDRRKLAYWAGGIAALLLLLIPLGLWLSGRGDDSEMERGISLFRSGAYADAASHFHRYALENPEDATPHLYLARIHRRLKRFDLAVPALRRAMQLAPEDPDVHTELGLLYTDTGRHDEAIGRLRQALRIDPRSEAAWTGLVRALHAAGRPDAARSVLAQAPPEVRANLTGAGAAGGSQGF